jgi:hypothetical protein
MEASHDYPLITHPTWCLWHMPKKWWAAHDPLHLVNHNIRPNTNVDVNLLNATMEIIPVTKGTTA